MRYELLETIDASHFYRTIDEAVEAFRGEAGTVAEAEQG